MTRYDAHSGVMTRATSRPRERRRATLAMKNAIGSPMRMHRTVTDSAMPTVSSVARRYAGSVKTSTRLAVVNVRTTALVNSSTLKNAVDSRENTAAK